MKYYHASKIRHRVGEVLVPKHDDWSYGKGIYMTTSPYVHSTIANNGKYFVYQVLPLNNKVRKGGWDDLIAPIGVEILKYVGQFDSNKKSSRIGKNQYPIIHNKIRFIPRYVINYDYFSPIQRIDKQIRKFRKGSNNLIKLILIVILVLMEYFIDLLKK